jgi:16S rRNA processing protein RimM
MGRVTGPFGVRGWVKVQPYGNAGGLAAYRSWWIESDSGWSPREIEAVQVHGGTAAAKFVGCDDRDMAARFRGREVAVARSEFPDTAAHEFYWADLIGSKVVNTAGEDLGSVTRVFETGANDVLVVVEGDRERLIPFIEPVVRQVDLAGRTIRVDWSSDF